MTKEEAKAVIESLREHLMDELAAATSERDEARVDRIQQGRNAATVIENALRIDR